MNGTLIVGLTVIFAIGAAVIAMLLDVAGEARAAKLRPVAVLLITESGPSEKALLRHYASQVAWIDAEVLQCVLLVYPPEDPQAAELCTELARDHEVYTAVPLPEFLAAMEHGCRKNVEIL